MRLNDFILHRLDDILKYWETNAQQILPDREFSREDLRNHIKHVLQTVAATMAGPPSELKHSKTSAEHPLRTLNKTWAHAHGAQRYGLGADIVQVAAEFRALRTTVLHLWSMEEPNSFCQSPTDLIRFDDAIDMAMADSVERYAFDKDKQDRLYRAMLSALPDACYILSTDGEFLYANEAMARLCGVPAT